MARSTGSNSNGSKNSSLCCDQGCISPIGICELSPRCEATSEERSAGNPHATFCGSRRWATASGHPVLGVKFPGPIRRAPRAKRAGDRRRVLPEEVRSVVQKLQAEVPAFQSCSLVLEEERLMKTPALFDLSGRVAVVTGGNGGIGRGIALGLAEAGAAVAVFGRNDEKNQRVLSELKAIGVPSIAVTVDVTNRAGLEPALNKVESELGGIGILVNNAGNVSLSGGVLQEKPEDWDNVIETQLNAVFLLSKLAARSMVSNQGGKIINIGSMYSFFGSGLVPSYSAAKGAIVQLTKSMAIELAPHNIQVNAIAPGWIETDMTTPVRTMPMNDEILARTPAGRWGQPEELAGTAVYLASRASDFVTGTTIRVDGGYAIR
jgi:2-deoxy-D-gluconate 3-dehydrogenase